MRAMFINDEINHNFYRTEEILSIDFDDDITCIKDENGEYDKYTQTLHQGLCISLADDHEILYFDSISEEKSKELCRQALETGFVDLTPYGIFKTEDEFLSTSPDTDNDNKVDYSSPSTTLFFLLLIPVVACLLSLF